MKFGMKGRLYVVKNVRYGANKKNIFFLLSYGGFLNNGRHFVPEVEFTFHDIDI